MKTILILAVSLMLTACGGGGEPEPTKPVVTMPPPVLMCGYVDANGNNVVGNCPPGQHGG